MIIERKTFVNSTMTIFIVFILSLFFQTSYLYQEQCINGYCFMTPGINRTQTLESAYGWCLAQSSRMVDALDNSILVALNQFLENRNLGLVFLNTAVYQGHLTDYTWFLLNGTRYNGAIGNQEGGSKDQYFFYACLVYFNDTTFVTSSAQPNDVKSFICEFDASHCVGNLSSAQHSEKNRCYEKYDGLALNWYQAREVCLSKGGDLTTFNYDKDESDYNYEPNLQTGWLNTSLSYWVGIRWVDWKWISPSQESGTEITHFHWAHNMPNNTYYACICINPDADPKWGWIDCDCNEKRAFVCMTNDSKSTTALTTTSMTQISGDDSKSTTALTTTSMTQISGEILGLILGLVLGLCSIILVLIVIIIIFIRRRRFRDNAKKVDNFSRSYSLASNTYDVIDTGNTITGYENLYQPAQRSSSTMYDKLSEPITVSLDDRTSTEVVSPYGTSEEQMKDGDYDQEIPGQNSTLRETTDIVAPYGISEDENSVTVGDYDQEIPGQDSSLRDSIIHTSSIISNDSAQEI